MGTSLKLKVTVLQEDIDKATENECPIERALTTMGYETRVLDDSVYVKNHSGGYDVFMDGGVIRAKEIRLPDVAVEFIRKYDNSVRWFSDGGPIPGPVEFEIDV